MSNDPRVEIPEGLRNVGIFGGIIMMMLGLLLGWVKSGRSAELPPTGVPRTPTPPGASDRIVNALVERIAGRPPGGTS